MKDSLERNALLSAVIVAVIVLVSAAACYRAVTVVVKNYSAEIHTREVNVELITILSLVKDAEAGTRGYVITGDERYLEPYNTAVREMDSHINNVRTLTADNPAQQKSLNELTGLINTRFNTLHDGQVTRREQGFEGIQRRTNPQQGIEEMKPIRDIVALMSQREKELLDIREAESEASRQRILLTFIISTVLTLGLIAVVFVLLRRGMAERRRSRQLLQEQKDWLAVTLTSIGDAVIATDPAGRVTFVNTVAETLTGYNHSEAVGKPLKEVFKITNEDTGLEVENPVTKVLREGVIVGLANHTILISKDGREIPVDDSGAPIKKESDGSVAGVILVFRDVTERKRNEDSMRASQERFAKAFSASPVPMSIVTYDEGRYVDVNESFLQNSGYKRDEIVGLTTTEINVYADSGERNRLRQILQEQGKVSNYEIRRRVKSGEIRIALTSSEVIELNGQRCILTTTNDVTERKRAEVVQARLAAIVESSDDAIISKDLNGIVTSWNAGAERVFGYTAEEIIGKSITILHPPDRPDEEGKILERLRRGDRIDHFETVRIRKDGRAIDVSLTISPIKDHTGHISGGSKIARDITEKKRAEQEREQLLRREQVARAEAESANRLKDEFLATVSHELRTPLTAILGWSALLKQEPTNERSVRKAMEVIERNAKAQTQIIGDILDVSRIITGKLSLDLQPVEMDLVIHAAINTVRPAIDAKDIKLNIALSALTTVVLGDPNRLQQIVWNLLSNAVKFTPKGGQIKISMTCVNSNIEIVISDSGMGINPEFLPYVFERFRQADASMTRSHGGLGLGLSIVRHLVELHGGTVSAESEGEDKGATFKLILPVAAVNEAVPRLGGYRGTRLEDELDAPLPESPVLSGLRVLVVDDEADARDIVTRVLLNCGAEVRGAASASEAMDIFLSWKPNVLISDLGMPREDGIAFIRKIRALPPELGNAVPAAALTAYVREDDRSETLAAGYNIHLAKPAAPAELAAAVATLAKSTVKT